MSDVNKTEDELLDDLDALLGEIDSTDEDNSDMLDNIDDISFDFGENTDRLSAAGETSSAGKADEKPASRPYDQHGNTASGLVANDPVLDNILDEIVDAVEEVVVDAIKKQIASHVLAMVMKRFEERNRQDASGSEQDGDGS